MVYFKATYFIICILCAFSASVSASQDAANSDGLEIDSILRQLDNLDVPFVSSVPLAELLYGVANKVYLEEKRSAIERRIAYLEADQKRIRGQMLEQLEMEESEARFWANDRVEKERIQRQKNGNWFAKAIAIGGMAAVISQAEGISSELAMEMAVQYSAGVLTDENPVELSRKLEQIARKHTQAQADHIEMLKVARARIVEQENRERAESIKVAGHPGGDVPRRVRDSAVPSAAVNREWSPSQDAKSLPESMGSSEDDNGKSQRVALAEGAGLPMVSQVKAEVATSAPKVAQGQEGASSGPAAVLKADDFCPDIEESIRPDQFAEREHSSWTKFSPGDEMLRLVVWSGSGACDDKVSLIAEARSMLMAKVGQKRVWAPGLHEEDQLRSRGSGEGQRLCPLPGGPTRLSKMTEIYIRPETISCSFIGGPALRSMISLPKGPDDFDYHGVCSAIYDVGPC